MSAEESFEVCFLGHQGWMFRAGRTTLLVDPLLVEAFGHGGQMGRIYPPRQLELSKVPPISAVVLSHEHEDHFNIPSLNRIDRAVPIMMSASSSVAAVTILKEMGFTVHLIQGGTTVDVGELTVSFFCGDHVRNQNGEEWDTLQYLVRAKNRAGNFFSTVDVKITDAAAAALGGLAEGIGIYAHSNNALNWLPMRAGVTSAGDRPYDSFDLLARICSLELMFKAVGTVPRAVLVCGDGFVFEGDRTWMNRNAFVADAERVCAALSALAPDRVFRAPVPGETWRMSAGRIVEHAEQSSHLRSSPRREWPLRSYVGDVELLEDYDPASGRRSLSADDIDELERGLADYAAHLYGRPEFRALCSIDSDRLGQTERAMALVLRTDGDWIVFAYSVRACRFERAECDDPADRYVSGMECWASDLLDLFRGHLNPTAVTFGKSRSWRSLPDAPMFNFCEYFHPLRRPEGFSTLYRQLLAAEPAQVERLTAADVVACRAKERER